MNKLIKWAKGALLHNEKDLWRFIRKNSELLTIPLALLVWFVFQAYAQHARLAVYDSGIFQKLVFALIAILVIKALTWIMLSIDQPELKKFLDPENQKKWFYLDEKQRMLYATFYFSLYFISLVLIVVLT